jgi:RimJ/RimL family protein N-acetyltransferase
MPLDLHLRDLLEADFPALFELQRDVASARMAAFGTRDTHASELAARWRGSRATGRTIVVDGAVVGFVASFMLEGKPNVTYWIAREQWGRGIASAALARFLQEVPERPLYASAARDNVASLRVLEKCGFTVTGSVMAFASARGQDVEEVFLQLG